MNIEDINKQYKTIMKYYAKLREIENEAAEYNKLEKLFEL